MKIFKKTLAMVLSIIMVFGIMPASVFMASAKEASACPIEGATGTGTKKDPVVVDTREELQAALLHEDELYIRVDNEIIFDIGLQQYSFDEDNRNIKHLTVNGVLRYNNIEEGSTALQIASNSTLYLDGTGTIISNHRGLGVFMDACLTINSDLSLIADEQPVFCNDSADVTIYDGVYESLKNYLSVERNGSSAVKIGGGSFPDGVDSGCRFTEIFACLYEDGEITADTTTIRERQSFCIYKPDIKSNYEIMPDLTINGLNTSERIVYAVGEKDLVLGYTVNALPQEFENAGYSLRQKLTVYSYNRDKDIVSEINDVAGDTRFLDNYTADTYLITVMIELLNPDRESILFASGDRIVEVKKDFKKIYGSINGASVSDEVKVELYEYGTDNLIATTYMQQDCTYTFRDVQNGQYTIKATSTNTLPVTVNLSVNGASVHQDLTLDSGKRSISGVILGEEGSSPINLFLYKVNISGTTELVEIKTVWHGDSFEFNNVNVGSNYILKATSDDYITYQTRITISGSDIVHNISMKRKIVYSITLKINGLINSSDKCAYSITKSGDSTVIASGTISGNAMRTISDLEEGKYTIVVSASKYDSYNKEFNVPATTVINAEMKYIPDGSEYGFSSQSPAISAEEIINGHTDLGLVNTLPTFSFTAKELPSNLKNAGYTIKTQTQVKYSSGATEAFDSTTWTCGNYYYGTNKVTQIVMLLDPNGNEIGRKTHTYTFTYAQLYFETRTPGVTNEQAAAGFSDLGTLTTAPKFAFSAYPLSSDLTKEGYSQTVKMEAYQDGELVYSADNGNTYIHIYPGEGKVVQTITLIDPDGNEAGSLAHTYNFTVEFPEGTISLSSDFLTLAENSTHQLSATFAPESLAETLVWTSSNSAVATIDSNGNITAVRPGSALIKATLGNGATAYCAVLVTADDVKAYVGGIGLREGEYLVQGSSIPTTTKPNGNYAYLSTVNGTLTLELHNYHYAGTGTFTSKNTAYGIYSTSALKIVAGGRNTIGPMSAPVDRYTSYGIGKGDTVSITSNANGVLNIKGVNTAISSSRYVMISGNLNITDVTSGISCTHAQAMGGINFQSGNVNIDCTGTAISVTGNYVTFTGADVTINCKAGINLVRQGEITIDSGSLKMYASASGINVKSGQAMTVNGGTAYIEAVNNAVALEGALNVNGSSIVLISTDTASDDSYSAISGAGTLTLASGISSVASTSSNYSTSSLYADSRRSTLDYVSFRGGSNYAFVKQPVGGDAKASGTMTITWETGFKPTKLELITFDGSSSKVTTLNSYLNYADFGVLPEGGYYQLRAYYATNYSITSDKFYVYSMAHTVTFDSGVDAQLVADGECAVKPSDPEKDNKFFYGWLTPDGKVFDFSTPITEDLVLTAGWADIKVNGVAMPDGTYLGQYSGAVATGRPSDHWAYYKDGVLTLYNFDSPYGAGIEFGEIDLTVVSTGEGNAVSCIVSDGEYVNLTIDGTATLNVGHEQWLDYAILVYNTITFKCDTIVECLDYTAIGDAEEIIVDGADVKVYAYCDMYFSNTIYGCEAPITVLNGSLYLYCEGDATNTDSYVTNLDKVLVYASDSVDGDLTDDHIIKTGGEAYDLELYRQIKITSYNTVKFHVDGYAVLMEKVATGACIEKPLDSDYGNRVFLGWYTEDGSLYDFNTPVTEELSLYAKFAVVEPGHGDFDFENNIISGILPGTTNLDYYGTFTNPDYAWSYQTENGYLGTGTVANVVNGDEVIESYSILLYGDVNGDGWCDGMDAVLVSCIVNGMLSESDIGELAYRAADCNHDGVIDEADVDLLNQAGALLAEVDQTKSAEVLLETSSAYVEYISLIDQTPEFEIEDETDVPDVEPEDTTPEQNAKIDIFEMIINFIKSIFEMLLAYIPVTIK